MCGCRMWYIQDFRLYLLQLITLETTLRLYWRDPRLQVEHLLGNKSGDDYVLLHPDASNFIWFPDIYIGERAICTKISIQ